MKNYFYKATLFLVITWLLFSTTVVEGAILNSLVTIPQTYKGVNRGPDITNLDSHTAEIKIVPLAIIEKDSAGISAFQIQNEKSASVQTMRIPIGQATHLLTGPWRFHLGDDMRWANPKFEDSQWETVDLTPAPGAHDGDVGLTDYVSGWWKRGYDGYTGYAWYRLHITFDAPENTPIALLAPPYVEDAYQLFWNGHLMGQSGDFSGETPVIYSTKPQFFRLSHKAKNRHEAVIAIRVWMRSGIARVPDAGGIHIPPSLGSLEAIQAQYQLDWLETIKGYVVEVIEPLAFLLLALLAWYFRKTISHRYFVHWLCAALLLTAAYRLNQATYTWMSFENLSIYIGIHRMLIPLSLFAWIMAWRNWYQLERWPWLTYALSILTLLSLILIFALPHNIFSLWRPLWRIPMAIVLLATTFVGLRNRHPDRWLTFIVVLFVAASQFSGALTALGVPGIWFPFGTGVSLTQYLYVGIIVGLGTMLIRIIQRALMN